MNIITNAPAAQAIELIQELLAPVDVHDTPVAKIVSDWVAYHEYAPESSLSKTILTEAGRARLSFNNNGTIKITIKKQRQAA